MSSTMQRKTLTGILQLLVALTLTTQHLNSFTHVQSARKTHGKNSYLRRQTISGTWTLQLSGMTEQAAFDLVSNLLAQHPEIEIW